MTETNVNERDVQTFKGHSTNIALMAAARNRLKGKAGLFVGTTLVYMLIMSVPSAIPKIGSVISLILGGPMTLGMALFFLLLARGKDPQFSNLFDGFNRFVQSLVTYLLIVLFVVLWTLLLIVPGIMAGLSYAMTFYILADNPHMAPMDAIRESKRMMLGYRWKLCCLGFRFIGWALLGIITFGIGFLWLIPYANTSAALFYEDLRRVRPIG